MKNSVKQQRYSSQIKAFKHIAGQYLDFNKDLKILIVGCGPGFEAVHMKALLGAHVFGVDIDQNFDETARQQVSLCNYDGSSLPFADQQFDAIYTFHVLEHVHNPRQMIDEMQRVLVPGGLVYIGVPNKSRIVGYFGMRDKSMKQKLLQNARDWRARLTGRFSNELGAHAGFSEKELQEMLNDQFIHINPVTRQYYHFKWPSKSGILNLLSGLHLLRFTLPSVYVVAAK